MQTDKLNFITASIIDQWMEDDNNRPWVIGVSMGKDSTMLLQMVWYAIRQLSQEDRQKREVYIVTNNTLVENPKMQAHSDAMLKMVEKATTEQGMPFKVIRTRPRLEDTFWVKLIGRGYPAPNRVFRWCTSRLKIDPTTRFIKDMVSKRGEVLLLLGTREAESTNRARSMKQHEYGHHRLRKHILPGTFMYPPLKDIQTEEVWQYLLSVPSPWGAKNRDLVTMYRNASGGECPLIIDKSTPSCGQSRFGCWTCTVVNKDRSMSAFIDNGEEWMLPLLEFRDLLAESKDRMDWREPKSRADPNKPGPYLYKTRVMLLEKLLVAQKRVQEVDPKLELISSQELIAIQLEWFRDGFFSTKVTKILKEVKI